MLVLLYQTFLDFSATAHPMTKHSAHSAAEFSHKSIRKPAVSSVYQGLPCCQSLRDYRSSDPMLLLRLSLFLRLSLWLSAVVSNVVIRFRW
jgi:hypothetical protein